MKTIAVFTDLSENARHASRFALHMAKKMKARVLLFQVSSIPIASKLITAGEQEPAPDDDPALSAHALSLVQELQATSFPGSFLPEVNVDLESTEIVDVMTAILQYTEICLIVIASAADHDLATYLTGDACNRIIDWATVPVLVVPRCANLRNFEKIAFATQLHEEDIHSIAELGSLLESFAAELMVAHLNSRPGDAGIRTAEEGLTRDLYQQLRCGGNYFRSIPDTDEQKNWDWLKANKRTDLLVVVQQSREQLSRFFLRGTNEIITHHLTLPVMILPKRP